MLRIADAVEVMAKRHTDLIDEVERLKAALRRNGESVQSLTRTLATTKGHLTRQKAIVKRRDENFALLVEEIKAVSTFNDKDGALEELINKLK